MSLHPGPSGALAVRDPSRALALAIDLGERALLLAFYGWFLSRILPSVSVQPYNLLVLISGTLTATLVLIRRGGAMATGFYAWFVAFAGTCVGLFVLPGGPPLVAPGVAGFVMMYGLAISLWAKLSLRRSFGIVAASRGIRRGGPYRFVRHPMYLGYWLTETGFLVLNPSLWNLGIYSASVTFMILRILEEEKILLTDPAYRAFAVDVRHRLIPGIF